MIQLKLCMVTFTKFLPLKESTGLNFSTDCSKYQFNLILPKATDFYTCLWYYRFLMYTHLSIIYSGTLVNTAYNLEFRSATLCTGTFHLCKAICTGNLSRIAH